MLSGGRGTYQNGRNHPGNELRASPWARTAAFFLADLATSRPPLSPKSGTIDEKHFLFQRKRWLPRRPYGLLGTPPHDSARACGHGFSAGFDELCRTRRNTDRYPSAVARGARGKVLSKVWPPDPEKSVERSIENVFGRVR